MSRPHRSYRKESLGDWGTIQDEQLTIRFPLIWSTNFGICPY